jgi:putative ABC transport system substrate-binding protein
MQAGACIALALWMAPAALHAAERSRVVAVVYPEIGEPFRSVFAQIIGGIEEQAPDRVQGFPVTATSDPQAFASELQRRDIRVVIALGRHGLRMTSALPPGTGVVVGGVLSAPEPVGRDVLVHTLAPDPGLLFAKLRQLVPAARRVNVVYDPRHNEWLMRRAREAARQHGLELLAHEVGDAASALRQYERIVAAADARRDALWLPHDATTVDDDTILPFVLRQAWNRDLPVFSSNVAHVKRGALFALYPDNAELGRTLALAATRYLAGNRHGTDGVQPLREMRSAINTRTAAHLGLAMDARPAGYDLVFPTP